MKIERLALRQLVDELSSSRPVPGGGSISCVTASLAAGLLAMACAISCRKEAASQKRKKLRGLAAKAKRVAHQALRLAHKDSQVFEGLMQLFRKRFRSDAVRKEAIQKALGRCSDSCEALACLAKDGMALSADAVGHVKRDMRSEVHTAMYLWDAAFHGAGINMEANLDWVRSKTVKKEARKRFRTYRGQFQRSRRQVVQTLGAHG